MAGTGGMYTVTINAETSGAKAEIQALEAMINKLKKTTINLNVNGGTGVGVGGSKDPTGMLLSNLKAINNTKVTPTIKMGQFSKSTKQLVNNTKTIENAMKSQTNTAQAASKATTTKVQSEAKQLEQATKNFKAAHSVYRDLAGKEKTVGLSNEEKVLYEDSKKMMRESKKAAEQRISSINNESAAIKARGEMLKAEQKTTTEIAKTTDAYQKSLVSGNNIKGYSSPSAKYSDQIKMQRARAAADNVVNENYSSRLAELDKNVKTLNTLETEINKSELSADERITKRAQMASLQNQIDSNLKAVSGKNYNKYLPDNRGNVIGTAGYGMSADSDEVKSAMSASSKAIKDGIVVSEEFNKKTQKMETTVKNSYGNMEKYALSYDSATGDITSKFMGNVNQVKPLASYMESLGHRFGEISRYMIASFGLFGATTAIRDGVGRVKELDDAMTELKKTSEGTTQEYSDFTSQANVDAKAIGSTTTQLTQSASDFTRLGYSLEEASTLSKNVGILKNVSEFSSIDEATEAMISSMEAFKIAPENSMDAIDKMNLIGNNYAISTDGIATALKSSASALVASGNDIDKSIAMITAGMKYCLCVWKHIQRTHLIAGNA